MKKTIFDPQDQQRDLSKKIAAGLERISQAFKVLLWDRAKELGLSPIQIQILVFITYHDQHLNNVSFLAREFNVTKPTISDAVKVLDKKGLIVKDHSTTDSRSYAISPSQAGKAIVSQTENFADPMVALLDTLQETDKEQFFHVLSKLIFGLNKKGVLSVQRTCYACRFYQKTATTDYCNLLEKQLPKKEIRLDCPEFESHPI